MSGGLNLTQHERLLEIASPLGPKALTLRRLTVREAIGQPFALTAEVVSENMDLKPAALVGKAVTCSIRSKHVGLRHFHGIVRGFARLGPFGRGLAAYRIETVPRLWQLSRTGDCRIFQDKSVKEIATAIFGEHEVAPVRWGGSVPAQKRPYCVQFNETDLDFVQRLLEEAGCGYFFDQAEANHTLVVCGANADYPLVPGDPQVVRNERNIHGALTAWQPGSALQPGKVAAQDFDGLKPASLLNANAATILGTPNASSFEMYRWPGGQHVRPEGDVSKLGMEGFEAGADRVTATGNDPTVFAGGRLKVRPGLDVPQPVTWLVTEVSHDAFDETHLSGGGTADYSNALTLQAADRPWRPPAPRPRPAMAGLHSAIVTGPAGEEIHCDEYGRVKVHFLWDRAGKRDDTSSCWVRVAQAYGGAWGGAQMLPRIKDEVLVGFVDGDPDRPVILGSLYNAEQKPVYALPANKTQSGIRTRSSKGGGATNFNELRFEDKKGSEQVSFQAEKDFKLLTKNDRDEEVGNNRTTIVTKGNDTLTVKMGNIATEASKGNISTVAKMGNISTLASMGNISVKADLGKIEINAMQSITLTCGASKIHMTPMGITLEAMQIDVKAKLMLNTEGLMSTHKGSAMMTIKGGLVMIN